MNSGNTGFNVSNRRAWLGIAAVLLVIGTVWLCFRIFSETGDRPAALPQQAPVQQQTLYPSSYQQTRRAFGPWELAAPNSTGAPHLVMLLADGGVDVSSKAVPVSGQWQEASAPEIDAAQDAHPNVRISTSDGNSYTVRYLQAFILASRPDTVYGYVRNGLGEPQLVSKTVSAITNR